ncbi:hypothetical protein [Cellulomonas sp. HZM]|uniref:hypothetical protein n=1 Tax=Cellulomonas sp. HZM TaxID=1454010 RepID=UPI000493613B|nr:hypothetical protein [Cellulomonas sp. HZM]
MIAPGRPLGARPRALAVVLTGALALGSAALTLAAGRLALHGCFDAGPGAGAALRLALLRRSADCPDGSFAAGGTVFVLLSVALPVLVAHALLALGGAGLASFAARAARAVHRVVSAALGRRADEPSVLLVGRAAPVVARPAPARTLAVTHGTYRRGPPPAA